jgi:hypothetical protein
MSTTPRKKLTSKKRSSTKSSPKKPELPRALAERAKAQHLNRMERLSERGRAAIARIRERQTDVAASMVDIGLALAELKAVGVAEALGRSGFAEVCALDLRMALSTANVLVALATRVPREVVTRLGTDRARAVLELVDATPEDDTTEEVLRAKLALPSGRTLDVANASAKEIRDAAKEIRDARIGTDGKRSAGFTTTPTEKRAFAAVARHLKTGGVGAARLVAARDGRGAKLRFELRLSELVDFTEILRKAAKNSST